MKLVCFPFSGGSSSIYLSWFKNIRENIEVYPVELAGRNKRFSEPLISSLEDTVKDLFHRLTGILQHPYAFFGHSLGCLIIYEMMQMLANEKHPLPIHVFLSGGVPPHYTKRDTNVHRLPDQEFLEEIVKMGGASTEFIKNKELQDIFLPIIRSDYKMFETHIPKPDKYVFPCDITVLAGTQDKLADTETAKKWSEYTVCRFEFVVFEGDHFFINKKSEAVSRLIENTFSKL